MDATLILIFAQVLKAFEVTQRISDLSIEANIMAARSEASPRLRKFFHEIETKRLEIFEERVECYQLLNESLDRLTSYAGSLQGSQPGRDRRNATKSKPASRQKSSSSLSGNRT